MEEQEESDYSSSLSIPDENINFDLVYTLHTFEATVDGQATVQKGDALTLLDDSNSYWWLIRNLQTSEVGYVPAENIETPFERLARLNKHRNLELTLFDSERDRIRLKKTRKRVKVSNLVDVQLQVLLMEDDRLEEVFEEWREERLESEVSPEPRSSDEITIRVYSGNVNTTGSYHTIRISENTSLESFLNQTLGKFHIKTVRPSGVEYYMTVKTHGHEEITLGSEDKPYLIYTSLNAHWTTPMPSITTTSQQVKKKKKEKAEGGGTDGRFYLYKRIRQRSQDGQVQIKMSYVVKKVMSRTFGFRKTRVEEKIDKWISTRGDIRIAELTHLALVKFHLTQEMTSSSNYELLLSVDGKEKRLDPELQLSDVLKDKAFFILQGLSSITPKRTQVYPYPTPLDHQTEAILKKVDAVLESFEPISIPSHPISVCRNSSGVDFHLPHGILRSTRLPDNKIQYTLMKNPNTLVLQKVLPDEAGSVTVEDLAALIQYGTHYLDTFDIVNRPVATTSFRSMVDPKEPDKSLSSLDDLEKELHRIISSHSF